MHSPRVPSPLIHQPSTRTIRSACAYLLNQAQGISLARNHPILRENAEHSTTYEMENSAASRLKRVGVEVRYGGMVMGMGRWRGGGREDVRTNGKIDYATWRNVLAFNISSKNILRHPDLTRNHWVFETLSKSLLAEQSCSHRSTITSVRRT